MSSLVESLTSWLQDFLLKIGCEEKRTPGRVSAARVIAYAFALTVVTATIIMAVSGESDHLLVAEVIAGTMTALGLRSRANPS